MEIARTAPTRTEELLALAERYAAHNYHPLPVVIASGEGAWVTDVEGTRYLDMLAAYSALNFGHRHPRLVDAAIRQLERVTLTSRAFHNDTFPVFCRDLAHLAGKDMVLAMNTGAEAVETAIKTARRWGYDVKGVAPDRAKIVVADGNFHGRTVTIVGFSDDPSARDGFGPFTPGFRSVPYGDAGALRDAIDDETVAFLVEPIQGEAGVIVPPEGYLRRARELCTERGAPFGGNPLACAIGIEVIDMLREGTYQRRSAELGSWVIGRLRDAALPAVAEVRGRGLWIGMDLLPGAGSARAACERLMDRGILAKDTHQQTIRLAPPLVVERSDLEWALDQVVDVLSTPAG